MQTRKKTRREAHLPSHKAAIMATAALLFLWVGTILFAPTVSHFVSKATLNLELFLEQDVLSD